MFGQLFRLLRAASVNLTITPAMRAGSKAPVRGGGVIMRILLVAAALAAASCCLVAAPASASQNQVSGIQSAGGTAPACGDPSASFTMTGGLVGCWYSDTGTFTVHTTASGTALIHAAGTEHFTGCLDVDRDGQCTARDLSGSLYFTYTFTGQYDVATGNEIRGRCHHPIVGGTGDFADATGVMDFKDDVSNGTAPYMGHIKS
jgi:hypothetical protein